ncbi:MAG: hypothetical protein QM308_02520, partial [Bacillota bacterium]|nr:hypothetical protein [Bacillota bacterium]
FISCHGNKKNQLALSFDTQNTNEVHWWEHKGIIGMLNGTKAQKILFLNACYSESILNVLKKDSNDDQLTRWIIFFSSWENQISWNSPDYPIDEMRHEASRLWHEGIKNISKSSENRATFGALYDFIRNNPIKEDITELFDYKKDRRGFYLNEPNDPNKLIHLYEFKSENLLPKITKITGENWLPKRVYRKGKDGNKIKKSIYLLRFPEKSAKTLSTDEEQFYKFLTTPEKYASAKVQETMYNKGIIDMENKGPGFKKIVYDVDTDAAHKMNYRERTETLFVYHQILGTYPETADDIKDFVLFEK